MAPTVVASAAIFCVHFGWPVRRIKAVQGCRSPESVDRPLSNAGRSAGTGAPLAVPNIEPCLMDPNFMARGAHRADNAHSRARSCVKADPPITTNDDQAGPIFSCPNRFRRKLHPNPSRYCIHELRVRSAPRGRPISGMQHERSWRPPRPARSPVFRRRLALERRSSLFRSRHPAPLKIGVQIGIQGWSFGRASKEPKRQQRPSAAPYRLTNADRLPPSKSHAIQTVSPTGMANMSTVTDPNRRIRPTRRQPAPADDRAESDKPVGQWNPAFVCHQIKNSNNTIPGPYSLRMADDTTISSHFFTSVDWPRDRVVAVLDLVADEPRDSIGRPACRTRRGRRRELAGGALV